MADSIMTCCFGSGFIGQTICVKHLREAYMNAMASGDKPLAAVIILKYQGKI